MEPCDLIFGLKNIASLHDEKSTTSASRNLIFVVVVGGDTSQPATGSFTSTSTHIILSSQRELMKDSEKDLKDNAKLTISLFMFST